MRAHTTTTTTTTRRLGAPTACAWPTTHARGLHRRASDRPTVATAAAAAPDRASWASSASSSAAAAVALATAVGLLSAVAPPACRADGGAPPQAQAQARASPAPSAPTTTVYFGNGCFWGRQKDFVDTELRALARAPERVTAVAGYAGGAAGAGAGGRVCYHFNDPRQEYERLGHAEVVAVELDGLVAGGGAGEATTTTPAAAAAVDEMRAFSKTYWSQFRRARDGRLQRLDPQDAGPGYRNVVGLPGGVRSPLFDVLKAEAPSGVQLREGQGRAGEGGGGGAATGGAAVAGADEGDEVGVVWVVDSSRLPFYRAEQYHQYHRGLEGAFPASYLRGQREVALKAGRIEPTGCLEFPF
jgi:peptide methionine sulfoxide reductase MsrA